MLLSRTAEQIYWLGRHLERIEGTARIVREHTDLIVDLPVDVDTDWSALLAITGVTEPFADRHGRIDEDRVVAYLLGDRANPGSLRSSLEAARENLRVSRPSFPVMVWNCVNGLRLELRDRLDRCDRRGVRVDTCERVVDVCQRIDGVINGSMTRGPAMRFLELGRLVERADLATRVLDVRATMLLGQPNPDVPPADRSPYEDVRWLGVLRSLNAQEMYRRASTVTVDGRRVTEFVLDDRRFPRSVGYCVDGIGELCRLLPEAAGVEDAHGRVEGLLSDRPAGPSDPAGLHEFLDDFQGALADLHGAVVAAYFTRTEAPAAA